MRSLYVVALVCVLALANTAAGQVPAGFGTVRVSNPNSVGAQIYTLNINVVGAQQWVPITTVGPRSFVDLPGYPNGRMVGAQLLSGEQITPIMVAFNPYQPLFLYNLPVVHP
jgi:hypothetical protein